MIHDFETYKYVIMKALEKTNPNQLTANEFLACAQTLQKAYNIDIDMSLQTNPAVEAKANIVLGLLLNNPEITKQPANITITMLSQAFNVLPLKLKYLGSCSSAKQLMDQMYLKPVNFPVKLRQK